MAKESRLQDEVGIFVIPKAVRPVSEKNYVLYIQPIGEELAKEMYAEAERIISKDYPNHSWFQSNVCHRKAGEDGIHGSSLELNVIYESILRASGLSLPGVSEGKHLDARGALSNGVYREYGFQVANEGDPNKDLSQHLIAEAKKRSWKLPLVVPSYRPLGHRKCALTTFEIYFLGDKEGINLEEEVLHGEKAREFLLSNFRREWIGDNGLHGLLRSWLGWSADGGGRGSSGDGRVDFVSGETTPEKLFKSK